MASSIRRRTGSRNSHERAGVSPCKCNSHKSTNVFAGCRGKELVRLTSVLAIDVDAGKETRIPRPKRSSEAPGGGALKALKTVTDATAGKFAEIKSENAALEGQRDRNDATAAAASAAAATANADAATAAEDREDAQDTLGYQVRFTNALQTKIDELHALACQIDPVAADAIKNRQAT